VVREDQVDMLDIHAGGVDLIFPHHEDEIAQSCAHTGQSDFASVWMHGEFLTMSGTKMSKRWGNILTARDLREEGVDAGWVRLLFATTHYRQALDFSDDSLAAAREGSRRLGEFSSRLAGITAGESSEFGRLTLVLSDEFAAAMDDDLNTPRALAALFEVAREGNRLLDAGEDPSQPFQDAWVRATGVLQVLPTKRYVLKAEPGEFRVTGGEAELTHGWSDVPPDDPAAAEQWASWWVGKRVAAKQARDFAESDRIRALLAAHGWEVRDTRDGSTVQRS